MNFLPSLDANISYFERLLIAITEFNEYGKVLSFWRSKWDKYRL